MARKKVGAPKVILSWSGGKDSAIALHEIKSGDEYEIESLLTTLSRDYDRVSMHGVRRELLEQQAQSLGLPLAKVFLDKDVAAEDYEKIMQEEMEKAAGRGIAGVVFADIFLQDLRTYREERLARVGLQGIFPLWKRDTSRLARRFIELGFRAVVTCVDLTLLDQGLSGRPFDLDFLADLPPAADPCGENGEFHSFVFDGPLFSRPVRFEKGRVVIREQRFAFCDLVPLD